MTRKRGFLLVAFLTVLVLMVGGSLPQSMAVQGGREAESSAAQIRLLDGSGARRGGGTLVDRNWVLTAAHFFGDADPTTFRFEFGVVNDQGGGSSTSQTRRIDRFVRNPHSADMIMLHFADPVPQDTWIPSLATQAPPRYSVSIFYGWDWFGGDLKRALGLTIDPVATENAAWRRSALPGFAASFPPEIEPLVINVQGEGGDSGGGTFATDGTLIGVHSWRTSYRHVNGSGNLYGNPFVASYEEPVWQFRDWILETIRGEGSSDPSPSDMPPRRQLTEDVDGDLPMATPPQVAVCDPGTPSCDLPEPHWVLARLPGGGNYRGTALAVCVRETGNTCSFDGTAYQGGAIGRLPLGPSTAPGTGPREVMAWCQTSNVFAEGASAQPALRVSFTNADQDEVPAGLGWWDVTPDQVDASTASLAAC